MKRCQSFFLVVVVFWCCFWVAIGDDGIFSNGSFEINCEDLPKGWLVNQSLTGKQGLLKVVKEKACDGEFCISIENVANSRLALFTEKLAKVFEGDKLKFRIQVKGIGRFSLHTYYYDERKVWWEPSINENPQMIEVNSEEWNSQSFEYVVPYPVNNKNQRIASVRAVIYTANVGFLMFDKFEAEIIPK